MRVAICDDEKIFFEQMESLLNQIEGISCVDKYDDIDKLHENLEEETYDIIFMDISWKGKEDTGVQFAASINDKNPNIQIVFMTAYNDKFAESIFMEKVNLCGYLIKPIKMQNLQFLMEKARKNIMRNQGEKILIKQKGNARSVLFSDILYLESQGHQLYIHTKTEKILLYKKLDEYEEQMNTTFVRVHKSYLVNMNCIKRIERTQLMLNNGAVLPISKNRAASTKNKYFRFMSEQL